MDSVLGTHGPAAEKPNWEYLHRTMIVSFNPHRCQLVVSRNYAKVFVKKTFTRAGRGKDSPARFPDGSTCHRTAYGPAG